MALKICKCIPKLSKRLKKKFGEDAEMLNLTLSGSGPVIRFRYHGNNENSSKSKAWSTSFIINDYCSLCGKSLR